MIFLALVSSDTSSPVLYEENSSSEIITKGIFASAHPVATVRSAFLQIIANGAELFDLIE